MSLNGLWGFFWQRFLPPPPPAVPSAVAAIDVNFFRNLAFRPDVLNSIQGRTGARLIWTVFGPDVNNAGWLDPLGSAA
ncbi:MAG TPA: hypothetical protein VLU54_03625 [Casimicrobiaceae bacterium]|nr:hypothetical protein [Casimicrobiaceae bacterium]